MYQEDKINDRGMKETINFDVTQSLVAEELRFYLVLILSFM
ncbi:hypothetical protein [Priestia megaterium]